MLFGVVGSLFSGLYFLYRDTGDGKRLLRALTLRIALSFAVLGLLVGGYHLGLIGAGS